MIDSPWQLLRDELDRWVDAGLKARLWLRDDDAIEPTPALERLCGLSHNHEIPVTLAAIPARTGEALARFIEASDLVSVAVHGWSHMNHAPAGEKKQELGPHRPTAVVLSELEQGFAVCKDLFGGKFVSALVPPWNRIDRALVSRLSPLGFSALSVFGHESYDEIQTINTHVDVIDWHGTRGCADHALLVKQLAGELAASRQSSHYAVGVLTHHLMHDDAAWMFLQRLFVETRHPAGEWHSLRQLMA
jgi:hypothetical protein